MRTFNIYSLSSFQTYNTVLLTMVTMATIVYYIPIDSLDKFWLLNSGNLSHNAFKTDGIFSWLANAIGKKQFQCSTQLFEFPLSCEIWPNDVICKNFYRF